jgi:hypothetical protein
MSRVRARGEEIRCYILENIDKHPTDISKVTSEKFGITRQAVNKHLRKLSLEGALKDSGATRNHSYKLAPLVKWSRTYEVTPEISESDVWATDIKPILGPQPENVTDIWQYGFTEMFNNAKDHAGSGTIIVAIEKTAMVSEIFIIDFGVGIFKKIQQAMNLLDERHSLLELAKGKFTTDPAHHTGVGIFFESRMFDSFSIRAGDLYFSHEAGKQEDWLLETKPGEGTAVFMKLSNHTSRTVKEIFDAYVSGEDYGFTKTVVPVGLAQYGDDKLISRSQAKRVLARVELFKTVLFDFEGLDTIGQSFADEIFRVFPLQHPDTQLIPIKMSEGVRQMVERARIGSYMNGSPAPAATESSKPVEESAKK